MSRGRPSSKPESVEDPEVKYKVDYSLDIVAHDLIQSGQLPAAKSYVLKSPQMKAHMERQVKSLNRRRFSMDNNENASKYQVTFKPLSLPIGIVTKFTPENGPQNKNLLSNRNSVHPSTRLQTSKKIGIPSRNRSTIPKGPVVLSHSKTVQLSTNHHPNEPKSTKRILQSITTSSNIDVVQETFSTKVDLKEFTNEEIALDVQAHTVTITGYRPRKGPNNSRKVTEIVQVPSQVQMERLRIGRRPDGFLIIEEYLPN